MAASEPPASPMISSACLKSPTLSFMVSPPSNIIGRVSGCGRRVNRDLRHRLSEPNGSGWRLRAPFAEFPDRDAELFGLVAEVGLDAGAGEDHDADRQDL